MRENIVMEATLITRESRPLRHYLLPHHVPLMFWRHGPLMRQLIGRAVAARYRGSLLGLLWSLIIPLVMLTVYTFVFSVVFQARWQSTARQDAAAAEVSSAGAPAAAPSKVEFALTLFCGLLLFNLFSETVSGNTGVIAGHAAYVKKVVFPLEILPVVTLGAALVNTAISLGLLILAMSLFMQPPTASLAYYPLVLLPLLMLCLGVSWFLASLGVYVRDVGPVTAVVLQMLVFLTPLFYSLEQVPERFRLLMRLNPLSVIVENARQTVMWNHAPDWLWLGAVIALSAVVMQLGYVWFMKTRRGFADVL